MTAQSILTVRFWYILTSLATGVSVITLILLLAKEQRRQLALSYAGFLGSLWFILLSFAVATFFELTGVTDSPELSPLALVVNGAGSIAYILIAPYFYHSVLGIPVSRTFLFAYRFVDGVTLAFITMLFVPPVRDTAMMALNLILFTLVAYGIGMIAHGYRRIRERSLRSAIQVFVFLAVLFFPLMLVESRPSANSGGHPLGFFTGFALPTFFAVLSVLSIPFALRRLSHPAFWHGGAPTVHFVNEFGLTAREEEVVAKLCAGMSNRQIGDSLCISPKTVENHLASIYLKTDVGSRVQLITLMISNR